MELLEEASGWLVGFVDWVWRVALTIDGQGVRCGVTSLTWGHAPDNTRPVLTSWGGIPVLRMSGFIKRSRQRSSRVEDEKVVSPREFRRDVVVCYPHRHDNLTVALLQRENERPLVRYSVFI